MFRQGDARPYAVPDLARVLVLEGGRAVRQRPPGKEAAVGKRDTTTIPVPDGRTGYGWLQRRLLLLVLLSVVLPLLLLGWGLYIQYRQAAADRLLSTFEEQLERHQKTLELYLADRKARLQLLAATHDLEDVVRPGRIAELLDVLNAGGWSYADLGIIDQEGRHLAYAGPFDLIDRNYAASHWFDEVMRGGVYVSDMFRGFRDEPHFVIAVARREGGRTWILRATIDTESFRALVEDVRMGRTGEVFLIDRKGRYQTRPRFGGEIMEPSGLVPDADTTASRVVDVPVGRNSEGRRTPRRIVGRVRLTEPAWQLVIRQDRDEAFTDLVRASRASLVFVHAAVLLFGAAGLLVTRRLLSLLRARDRLGADLQAQLLRAGKMAALGEMAAGVAHEINNPLAIIATERQLLLDDLDGDRGPLEAGRLRDALDQVATQVARCRRITHALLDFARPAETTTTDLDLNRCLEGIAALVEREAGASGIGFRLDLAPDLPAVQADPDLLQQVFLNLVNNAVDAQEGRPGGTVTLRTRALPDESFVEAEVADTGSGVAPGDIERIFDPFFTTKPTGQGTGLGLSICLGIVRGLGGDISVRSEPGQGTRMRLVLPARSASPSRTEAST